jgi:hypothetical protein
VKLLVATSVDHGLVSLDWPLPSAREPDSRMQTLADVLFGLDIRELEWCLGRRGISTRATAAYTFRERGSSLRLTAEVPKGRKPQEVIEAIDDALRELGAGVREESVRGAVAAVARSHTSAFELLGARADRLAFAMARTGRASRAYADPVEPSPAELARLFAALQHMPRVVTIFQVDPAASLAGDLRERRGVAGVP